mgnify:CR=1 FL=1|jgi:hypothetical protein|tara:strand:- start:34 stop:813 length:780 start_codon:yes stop_codon:yes gene_type:complete
MIRNLIIMVLLLSCNLTLAQQIPDDRLQRVYEATVRVKCNGGIGTGTVFDEDDRYYYILTNDHVVDGGNYPVTIEYNKKHRKSGRLSAKVIGRKHTKGLTFDIAILRLSKLKVSDTLPVIPIGTDDPKLLLTCGCQAGAMPSVQQCLVVQRIDNLVKYSPTSLPGRSGSAMTDVEGKEILGLVAWMTGGENSVGVAMTGSSIRDWCYSVVNAVRTNNMVLVRELETKSIDGVVQLPTDTFLIPLAREEDSIPEFGDSDK